MKTIILTLLILTFPYLVNAQSLKNDMKGKIGITLYGGSNTPANGDFSSAVKTTDYLNTGSQFGLGVSFFITKGFGIEGTFYGGYNHHSDKYKPAGKEPLWVNFSTNINAIYNFGHMFKKPVISPFVRIGIGSYHLEQFEDGLIGAEIAEDKNNHKVSSFGFNVGAGAEYFVKKNFTIGLILDYVTYYPKHEDRQENVSSDDRTVHSYFSPQIKLSYYIPVWR